MMISQTKKAVIYSRTATTTLSTPNAAIAFQQQRCETYARQHGYEIVGSFHDIAPGTGISRNGLDEMLAFIAHYRGDGIVVLVDDVHVLARDPAAFITIRDAIRQNGACLASVAGREPKTGPTVDRAIGRAFWERTR